MLRAIKQIMLTVSQHCPLKEHDITFMRMVIKQFKREVFLFIKHCDINFHVICIWCQIDRNNAEYLQIRTSLWIARIIVIFMAPVSKTLPQYKNECYHNHWC